MPRSLIAAAVFAAATASAQTPAPEMATHELDSPATFSTKVSLVLVPVVIRDKKGQPIGTLKKEDFELYDKGKLQTIVKFSVEKAGSQHIEFEPETPAEPGAPVLIDKAPGAVVAERYTVFLFDDLHLKLNDLMYVRLAAEKHLAEVMLPTERVGVYTTSGRISLELTSDREKIVETMRRIVPVGVDAAQATECPPLTYYMADLIVNKNDQTALMAAAADAKVCIGLPMTPAQLNDLATTAARRKVPQGEADATLSLTSLRTAIRVLASMPGQRNLVLVSPGFLVLDSQEDLGQIVDMAIRRRVTINTLDARGLHLDGIGADASDNEAALVSRSTFDTKGRYSRTEASLRTLLLEYIGEGTGGIAFANNNDLAEGFRKLTTTPEYTYMLGFSPMNLKLNGEFHTVKVKLRDGSQYTIQARRGYYAPKHLNDPADQAKQEIQEAVFSREVMRDLPVELHTQYFKSGEFDAKLGVLTKVDLAQLHFKKAEDRNLDNLTIVAALFDKDGNLLMGTSKMVELKVRDETLKDKAHSVVTFKSSFDVKTGPYVIRVVVRDSEGQLMAAQNGSVVIP